MNEHHQLQELVEKLKKVGVTTVDISTTLNLFPPNKKSINGSILTKLCKGGLKSYRDVKIQDMVLLLQDEYSKYLNNPTKIDITNIKYSFLLYYWDKKQYVTVSLLLCSPSNLQKGRLVYLVKNENQEFIEKASVAIKSIYYKNSETLDIVFKDVKHSGYSFITTHIGNKKLEEIETTFCSYSGSMESLQRPYAGIGILVKIKENNIDKALSEIKDKGIPFRIKNILHERRLDLNDHEVKVHNYYDEILDGDISQLRMLKGVWQGYFLSRDIEGEIGSGGFVHFLLKISESGISKIEYYLNKDRNETIVYNGILKFPNYKLATIIVGQFEKVANIPRINLYLEYDNENLKGIITGWRALKSDYFTSPVFLKKHYGDFDLSDENIELSLLERLKPSRYHYSDKLIQQIPEVLRSIRKIQDEVFNTTEKSLRLHYSDDELSSFTMYKKENLRSKLEFMYVGVSNTEKRKFSFHKNIIDFANFDNQSELLLSADYKVTPFTFKINIKELDKILIKYLNPKEYSITYEKNKLIVVYYNTIWDSMFTHIDIDHKETEPEKRSLYQELADFYKPFLNILEMLSFSDK